MIKTPIHDDVICPECGNKNASIIINFDDEGKPSHAIFCTLCGLTIELTKYAGSLFVSAFDTSLTVDTKQRLLNVYSKGHEGPVAKGIRSLLLTTNGFFTKVLYTQDRVPDSLTCPICSGTKFNVDGQYVVCLKKHYQVPIDRYLKRFVQDHGFTIYIDNPSDGSFAFRVLFEHPGERFLKIFPPLETRCDRVLQGKLRFNEYTKSWVIIINPETEFPKKYQAFVSILKSFEEYAKIIIKNN